MILLEHTGHYATSTRIHLQCTDLEIIRALFSTRLRRFSPDTLSWRGSATIPTEVARRVRAFHPSADTRHPETTLRVLQKVHFVARRDTILMGCPFEHI